MEQSGPGDLSEPEHEDLTRLLEAHAQGDRRAFERIVSLVYDHLRRIARTQLDRVQGGRARWNTLDTTALVHEAYVKLVPGQNREGGGWRNRDHFFAACAQAMRHILVDAAKRRMSLKRGEGVGNVTLTDKLEVYSVFEPDRDAEVLAVDKALSKLAAIDPKLASIVECRFFAGFTVTESAEALGISGRTAHRLWQRACAWLKVELS